MCRQIGGVAARIRHVNSGHRPDHHAEVLLGALGRYALLDYGGSELLLRQNGRRYGAGRRLRRAAGTSRCHDRWPCSRLGPQVVPHREHDRHSHYDRNAEYRQAISHDFLGSSDHRILVKPMFIAMAGSHDLDEKSLVLAEATA
jgi:hypothetical protein